MFRFVKSASLIVRRIFSILKGTSYFFDTEHENLQKWVNSCNLTNDVGQHYYRLYPFIGSR